MGVGGGVGGTLTRRAGDVGGIRISGLKSAVARGRGDGGKGDKYK